MAESWQTVEQAAVSLGLSVRTVTRHIVAGKLQSRLNDGRREVLADVPEGPPAPDAAAEPRAPAAPDTPAGPDATARPDARSSGATAKAPAGSPVAQHSASRVPNGPAPDATSAVREEFVNSASANPPPLSSSGQSPSGTMNLDQETVLALADNAAEKAEMAVTAYQALARVADGQTQQVRRNARVAWAAVAAMAVGVTGAVGWTMHKVTRLSVERDNLIAKMAEQGQAANDLSAEREALRADLVARQEALRVEVAAAREQAARTEGKLAALIEQEQERQTRDALAAASAATSGFSSLSLDPTSAGRGQQPTDATDATDATVTRAQDLDRSPRGGRTPSDDQQSSTPADDFPRAATAYEQRRRTDDQAGEAAVTHAESDAGASETDLAAARPSRASAPSGDDVLSSDARPKAPAPAAAKSDSRPRSRLSDGGRVAARKTRPAPATTRPTASRRKARLPARRAAPSSDTSLDTSSASTADDR